MKVGNVFLEQIKPWLYEWCNFPSYRVWFKNAMVVAYDGKVIKIYNHFFRPLTTKEAEESPTNCLEIMAFVSDHYNAMLTKTFNERDISGEVIFTNTIPPDYRRHYDLL